MRPSIIFLCVCTIMSCTHPQPKAVEENQTMDLAMRNMSDSAKQLLIDISNAAWFQSQVAQAGLGKMQDTALLSLAQMISKQYTHIKDKAQIVSVPYKLNMPYFLKPAQNARVKDLKAMDVAAFTKEFIGEVYATNDSIITKCTQLQSMVQGDSDILGFITYSKAIVERTQSEVHRKM